MNTFCPPPHDIHIFVYFTAIYLLLSQRELIGEFAPSVELVSFLVYYQLKSSLIVFCFVCTFMLLCVVNYGRWSIIVITCVCVFVCAFACMHALACVLNVMGMIFDCVEVWECPS